MSTAIVTRLGTAEQNTRLPRIVRLLTVMQVRQQMKFSGSSDSLYQTAYASSGAQHELALDLPVPYTLWLQMNVCGSVRI
jgi:hypothetical protein